MDFLLFNCYKQDARGKIWMCDVDGLLTTTRTEGHLEGHKKFYAKDHPPVKDLAQVVKEIKPSVSKVRLVRYRAQNDKNKLFFQIIIGASATPGLFTPEILQDMAKFHDRPIVFALSNPTSRAECTAEVAFNNTEV